MYDLSVSTSISEQTSDVSSAILQKQFSPFIAPHPITIDHMKKEVLLVKNVNNIQRDQYATDKMNAKSQEQTGYNVKIQRNKDDLNEKDKHRSLLPTFKVIII